MSYRLSKTSRSNLEGVHPKLVNAVEYAIQITRQDFTVFDGLRTAEEQRELVTTGASHTTNSKHLPQDDGYSHAVDLVPYIGGKLRWEMGACHHIAFAMRLSATRHAIDLRWGGVWDRRLSVFRSINNLKIEVNNYIARRLNADLGVFLDGVHFEIFD